jgi:2-succinyl-5-enolpyruvyl-6-hydroxy-3-cyclohexene-1-carboxylate synthase
MNRNTRDVTAFVDELVRAGVRHVCLSPGSRNTPLVFAAARQAGLTVSSHLDERCAAFFALGIGIATGMPAVLVCTSGSAAANYFPAIVEAHQARVPMIVLTADRPHELRHSGANQTMKQPGLFGGYALWSLDLALPEATPSALVSRNLRASANRAVAIARGVGGARAGVVHVNMPFRPPLEPTPVASDLAAVVDDAAARPDGAPFVTITDGTPAAPETGGLAGLITRTERGLIVCGPRTRGVTREQLGQLAAHTGYPLICDAASGVRFGSPEAIGAFDTFLQNTDLPPVELVLRFGDVPTSKWLNQYLDQSRPATVTHISHDGVWADDSHRVSHFVHTDPGAFCNALCGQLGNSRAGAIQSAWHADWRTHDAAVWQRVDAGLANGAWFDAIAVHDALALAPPDASVCAGNSLPVRHVDQFGRPDRRPLFVHASRGVSGIDGNVSTALGIGHARPGKRLILIIGDVTLYHDMNGLLAVRRCGVPVTLVLLNNNGGGIFQRLPVNAFGPEFTEHFVTPHGLDFAHTAALYGLDHVVPADRAAYQAALLASFDDPSKSVLIEVRTDAKADLAARKALVAGT